jgi:hypothetical protein
LCAFATTSSSFLLSSCPAGLRGPELLPAI